MDAKTLRVKLNFDKSKERRGETLCQMVSKFASVSHLINISSFGFCSCWIVSNKIQMRKSIYQFSKQNDKADSE